MNLILLNNYNIPPLLLLRMGNDISQSSKMDFMDFSTRLYASNNTDVCTYCKGNFKEANTGRVPYTHYNVCNETRKAYNELVSIESRHDDDRKMIKSLIGQQDYLRKQNEALVEQNKKNVE